MKRRVAYFTDIQHRQDVGGNFAIKESKSDTGSFSFLRSDRETPVACGESHLMDPQRLRMVHALILSLGLRNAFQLHAVKPCERKELRMFHSPDYVEFLSTVSHENIVTKVIDPDLCHGYNIGPVRDGVDCTAFDGLFEYTKLVTGGSLDAARELTANYADIAINWAGGFHHAKQSNAAGFCYVNDCVIAIVELLKKFDRVLYVDIDFHHGDGVEQAFYITDRVCTVSFHRFGPKRVFPGTGDIGDHGDGLGAFHSINVPLLGGIGDTAYVDAFQDIVGAVVEKFKPGAIVLQAGADSLTGDSVGLENGSFNLSTEAHAKCVEFVRDLNIPLLVLGGGGYSKHSVAKCWAIDTAILCGKKLEQLPKTVPENDFYFKNYTDKNLHVHARKDAVDFNAPSRIESIKAKIHENIQHMRIYSPRDDSPHKSR